MWRLLLLPLSILLTAPLLAEEELPQDPGEPFDIEPPLLIQEIPNREPIRPGKDIAAAKERDPEEIQLALDKARKSAAVGERLYKNGVIAKVDAENRLLKVIRLESELAEARLELARQTVASQQARFDAGEISQNELDAAKAALSLAAETTETAVGRRDRAELEAALLNLSRQKKLLALGSGRRSEVNRAEEKVASLQQPKN